MIHPVYSVKITPNLTDSYAAQPLPWETEAPLKLAGRQFCAPQRGQIVPISTYWSQSQHGIILEPDAGGWLQTSGSISLKKRE